MRSENETGDDFPVDDTGLGETERDAIRQWQALAKNWHDELPPPWQAPRMASNPPIIDIRSWFATLASTAALVLVLVMYFQGPETSATPVNATPALPDYGSLPRLPQATQAAMVESVLASSRDERQQELQALITILKGEMDKRAYETEESLRYVIAYQLQGQKELEELYQQVEELMLLPDDPSTRVTR